MQANRLLIAALVLAGLGGAIWWSNRQPADSSSSDKTASTSVKLMSLTEADLTELKVEIKGEAARLYKKDTATQKWSLTSEHEKDPSFRTDSDAVQNVVNSAAIFSTDKLVDENATDLIQYGLDPPQIVVEIKDKNGKTDRVNLGDETPVGQMVYAAKPGTKKIYTVAKHLKDGVTKSAFDVRDKRLLPIDESKVSRFEWSHKGESLEFGKNAQGDWQIVKPEPMRADNLAVGELFRKAKDAKYETALTPEAAKKNAVDFASGTVIGSVKITDANGVQSLEVRKTKENAYLAKSSGVAGIYSVSEELGTGLDKPADTFRNMKLFDFGHDDVERIEFKKDGKTTLVEKKGEDWQLGGKKADAASVTQVVDLLRAMQGLKIVKKSMGTANVEISVKAKNSKAAEKLFVSANGNFRYTQREGDPAEYELDPKVLSDLEAAFQAIQLEGQQKNQQKK
jgi:hypothetical protein